MADPRSSASLAATATFDLAILDINLEGQSILPVAQIIEARGLPFLLASGYASMGLPQPFHDRPILRKPFVIETLGQFIRRIAK
jgi:hypothetical protein